MAREDTLCQVRQDVLSCSESVVETQFRLQVRKRNDSIRQLARENRASTRRTGPSDYASDPA